MVRGKRSLLAAAAQTVASERVHWCWLLFSLPFVAFCCAQRWTGWSVSLALANVPLNAYPIMIQRLNRAKVARVEQRLHARARLSTAVFCRGR